MIDRAAYDLGLKFIDQYWDTLTCSYPKDKRLHLGLPNPYVAPNTGIFRNDQFYWDSYFVVLGLVISGRTELAKGMVDNLCFLFDRFGIIPMRNRYYNLGTSQIPFLTSMALEVFHSSKDIPWLKKVMRTAEKELKGYWMNPGLTERHIMDNGLCRYCDHFITHLGSEHESGWDMTSRFKDKCLDYLPVDLNSCLYKYEMDLADFYSTIKDPARSKKYRKKASDRKKVMNELMWNNKKKFFFDYNNKKKIRSKFYSVAGFYPLWAGIATSAQARFIHDRALPIFEHDGGIVNTQSKGLSDEIRQHDFPNGWPNQQWIVIKGLLNYGYRDTAERIARKWLHLNETLFHKTGLFWEKYNVVTGEIGLSSPDRYPTQSGFGWTNAIFARLIWEFEKRDEK